MTLFTRNAITSALQTGVMDLNRDIVSFNPMPYIVALAFLLACGLTYRRTRSWTKTAMAAGWVVVGYVLLVVVVHALGFE